MFLSSSHDLIGVFLTNVNELAKHSVNFELKNPKKTHKKKYVNSGVVCRVGVTWLLVVNSDL